ADLRPVARVQRIPHPDHQEELPVNVADLPQSMTVIEISTPGGPEVLTPVTRAMPAIGAGDVLIRVDASGVNRPDLMQRLGKKPTPPGAPHLPGQRGAPRAA